MSKKKVVYLLGAGSTEAVVKAFRPDKGLLTPNIQDFIRNIPKEHRGVSNEVWGELITEENDVEHLISVLESQYQFSFTEKVRKHYRDAIVNLSHDIFPSELPINLYSVLIDLHKNVNDFDEELLCIITLNYEDILERTIVSHFGYDVDYLIDVNSAIRNESIKVLKLHGSFTWFNSRPILVSDMNAISSENTLWIPPGVEKRKEAYPFNLLWGEAFEYLMKCDIIRIVGCSLSRVSIFPSEVQKYSPPKNYF